MTYIFWDQLVQLSDIGPRSGRNPAFKPLNFHISRHFKTALDLLTKLHPYCVPQTRLLFCWSFVAISSVSVVETS